LVTFSSFLFENDYFISFNVVKNLCFYSDPTYSWGAYSDCSVYSTKNFIEKKKQKTLL